MKIFHSMAGKRTEEAIELFKQKQCYLAVASKSEKRRIIKKFNLTDDGAARMFTFDELKEKRGYWRPRPVIVIDVDKLLSKMFKADIAAITTTGEIEPYVGIGY